MKRTDEAPTPDTIQRTLLNDELQRKEDTIRFLKMLLAVEPPYTFLIDSPWGTGKTFFVKQIEQVMKCANPALDQDLQTLDTVFGDFATELPAEPFLPIYFNAWENDHFDNPILPLLATISNATDATHTTNGPDLKKAFAKIMDGVLSTQGINTNVAAMVEELHGEDFLDKYKKVTELRGRIDQLITQYLPEIANKAVIFIDELDRCRPEFAIKLLEQSKTLFQLPNLIVVYSADVTQLSRSLEGVYGPHFEGRQYLERFFDKRVELSPVDPGDYLCQKGLDTKGTWVFLDTAIELLRYKSASLRTLNRLADPIQSVFEYLNSQNYFHHNERSTYFPKLGILPVLIILSYYHPDSWHDVRDGSDFSSVYPLARHSVTFLDQLDASILEIWGVSIREETDAQVIEEKRAKFTEDICALLFIGDPTDQRVQDVDKGPMRYANRSDRIFKTLQAPSD